LRGKKGGLQTEVDVFGNRQKVLAEIKPVPGCNLVVSIIPALQKTAEVLLNGKTGAVVAMSPSNGEILVLASSPGFDSNLFARGIDYKEWKALIENPFHPLLNRAIQSQQPPGSVFKIVTAVAALEEKIVDPNEKFFCPGHFKLGRRKFNCWKRGGHGWLQMKDAIIESCDTYFYNISLRVGIDNIIKYSKLLGFGEKTEVELEGEKSGLVPSPKWKKTKYGSAWQKGETLNMSIGQGFLLATPLQIAVFFCGIANKGLIPKPRIVLEVTCEDFQTSFPPSIRKAYHLSPETFFLIKEALTGVVNSQKGTGRLAKTDSFVVAGKTGTSQVASIKNIKGDIEDIPWKLKAHAWFACFAPVEKPEIVVSVLLEHGGSGGKEAAPIAGEIIKAFKKLKKDV
jgi:penicillin-binding protein 2